MRDQYKEFVKSDYAERIQEYNRVYQYLDKYMNAPESNHIFERNPQVKENKTVWTIWFQGLDKCTTLSKLCIDSVKKNLPEGYDYIILTEVNLKEFIILPEYIWNKYRQGLITKTHLSDIIRVELLSTYGGCWIDSTVFCSEPIRSCMISGSLFLFRDPEILQPVIKVNSWWIYSEKGNSLIRKIRDILYDYWMSEDDLKHYFLIHIIMARLLDEDEFTDILNDMPFFSDSKAHILWNRINDRFSHVEWLRIKDSSPVHKMSNKRKILRGDIQNFYSVFMEGGLK